MCKIEMKGRRYIQASITRGIFKIVNTLIYVNKIAFKNHLKALSICLYGINCNFIYFYSFYTLYPLFNVNCDIYKAI
jgi:hypothetical protein